MTGALAGEAPAAGILAPFLICLFKAAADGCHLWKGFLMSKAKIQATDKSSL